MLKQLKQSKHAWVLEYINIFLATLIYVLGARLFLIHANLFSGGVFGASQLLSVYTDRTWGMHLNVGFLNFLLNAPLIIFAYFKIGHKYTYKVLFYVALNAILLGIIPNFEVTDDRILNCLLSGFIMGGAMGYIFKSGGSTGGVDIPATYLLFKKNINIAGIMFAVNAVILVFAAMLFDVETALFTMLQMFIASTVLDRVYEDHHRVHLFIITAKGDAIKARLLGEVRRGVTVLDGRGGFTNKPMQLLLTVVSKFEVKKVMEICREEDPATFIEVLPSEQISGNFSNKKNF